MPFRTIILLLLVATYYHYHNNYDYNMLLNTILPLVHMQFSQPHALHGNWLFIDQLEEYLGNPYYI